jgi:hypothetical protein
VTPATGGHARDVVSDFAVSFSVRQRDLPAEARVAVLRELGHVHPTTITPNRWFVRIRCEVRANDADEAVTYVVDRVAAFLRAWYGLEPRVVDVVVDELVAA